MTVQQKISKIPKKKMERAVMLLLKILQDDRYEDWRKARGFMSRHKLD